MAQQPSIDVQDLLVGEASSSRAEAARLVRRVSMGDGWFPQRRMMRGEARLVGPADSEEPFLTPQPFFDERALLDLVMLLRPGADDRLELLRFGERMELRSRAPEQLQAALVDVRAALPPRVRCRLRVERQVGDVTTVLLQGEQEFSNGETLVIGDVEQTSQVLDVEVEIAQAAAVGNPVKMDVTYGTSAVLRMRPLPWTDDAVVECVVRHAAPFRMSSMPRSSTIGSMDRHASRIDEAGLVFRITNGTPSRHEWLASDGSTLRVVCDAGWQQPAEPRSVVVTPLLDGPVLGFRSSRRGEPDEATEMLPVHDMIVSRLERRDDGGDGSVELVGKGDRRALLFEGDDQSAAVKRMFTGISDALRPVAMTIEVLSVPAGAEFAADGGLPEDSRRLWQASGPGVVGLPSCFTTGHERSYVRDWDVEVAQAARIADPKVSICEDGWFATVKALPSVAGRGRRVELALQQIDFVELARLDLVVGEQVNASTDSQEVVLPREELSIEKAVTRAVEVATMVTLDDQGTAVLRRSAARTLGDGRELVVRLTIR